MRKVIDRKVYDTEKAVLIGTNDFRNKSDKFNMGRTHRLYRTKGGEYFVVYLTHWSDENDLLAVLPVGEAIDIYEGIHKQVEEFETAFPGVEITDA